MTTFAYTSLEPSGKRKTGFVDAPSREAAMAAITADGRFILEIREEKGRTASSSAGAGEEKKKKGKVTRSDLALFSRRLADLSMAGLPLDRVLQVVAEQSESEQLAHVAEAALEEVRSGLPVSEALAKYPKLFPPVFALTLRAGEASGQFGEVASRLADFQEKEVTRRSQIVSALIYPAVLAFTAVFVVIFMLTFVVPKLSSVFDSLGNDLPVTTKMLLAFTDFLVKDYLVVIGTIVGAILLFRAWVATPAGALSKDKLLLTMPVIGPVVKKATVSRFSRVLGTLIFGGVPILEALKLSGLAAGNRLFRQSADKVVEDVRDGRPIADSMRDTAAFPPVLTHMVAIGEETGDLPKMLNRVSDSLDFEVDNGMRRLVSFVEPVIVLAMGVIVGFVVLSVLLPIFEAQNTVK